MDKRYEKLTQLLLSQNAKLDYDKARTWIELLWEDFETTRAKAGEKYEGQDMTESIVTRWIMNYGPRLHEFNLQDKYDKYMS